MKTSFHYIDEACTSN